MAQTLGRDVVMFSGSAVQRLATGCHLLPTWRPIQKHSSVMKATNGIDMQ